MYYILIDMQVLWQLRGVSKAAAAAKHALLHALSARPRTYETIRLPTATSGHLSRLLRMLGRCLQGVPRESYYLATKLGRYGDTASDFDFSAARVRRSVKESLELLGVQHLDLIQVRSGAWVGGLPFIASAAAVAASVIVLASMGGRRRRFRQRVSRL